MIYSLGGVDDYQGWWQWAAVTTTTLCRQEQHREEEVVVVTVTSLLQRPLKYGSPTPDIRKDIDSFVLLCVILDMIDWSVTKNRFEIF